MTAPAPSRIEPEFLPRSASIASGPPDELAAGHGTMVVLLSTIVQLDAGDGPVATCESASGFFQDSCKGQPWIRRVVPPPCIAQWPDLYAEAVDTDALMRDQLAFAKEPPLHSWRFSLAEVVRLDKEGNGFIDEC